MAKAVQRKTQTTVTVGDHKIKIVISTRSSMGNFIGYKGEVSDNMGNTLSIPCINKLRLKDAQEIAYSRFVQKYV